MTTGDRTQRSPTFTERVDRAVLAAEHKRGAALLVLGLFGLVAAVSAALLVTVLLSGDPDHTAGPLLVLGMLAPALLLLACVVGRRPPGCAFWVSLLLGGTLIAAGPALALFAGGWHTQIYISGRWGSGSTTELITVAPILWALAALMIVPGTTGVAKAIVRARGRTKA